MTSLRLSAEQRRALTLLANSRDGINEVLLVRDHDFSRGVLASLVRHQLVAIEPGVMMAGEKTIEVAHFWITDAGRDALAAG